MEIVDARGLSCPIPVVRTMDTLTRHHGEIIVLVDDETAMENVSRLAASRGYRVEISENAGDYKLAIS